MSEEQKPKPKFRNVNTGKPMDTFMPPETMGKMKGPSVWDMSIDELIEYRSTGVKPQRILDVDAIFALAKCGASIKVICELFSVSTETFINNSAFLDAHRRGRSEIATRNRAAILEQAQNGNLQAQMYLDKFLGGDIQQETVNLNVTHRPLEQIPTEDLIEIAFKEKGNESQ